MDDKTKTMQGRKSKENGLEVFFKSVATEFWAANAGAKRLAKPCLGASAAGGLGRGERRGGEGRPSIEPRLGGKYEGKNGRAAVSRQCTLRVCV